MATHDNDIRQFNQDMVIFLNQHRSVLKSLRLSQQQASQPFRTILGRVILKIESGCTLHEAMVEATRDQGVFSQSYLDEVALGQMGHRYLELFEKLARTEKT